MCKFSEFRTANLLNGSSFDPYNFFAGAYAFHAHYKGGPIANYKKKLGLLKKLNLLFRNEFSFRKNLICNPIT